MTSLENTELETYLLTNKAKVTFTKADGTDRVMYCTLIPDFLPEKGESKRTITKNPEVVRVWDIENDGWRSFRFDSIKKVEFE